MSKDNFSFIDEVFEQYQLGDATLKHQKAVEQAKQELQQGFKAAMLEVENKAWQGGYNKGWKARKEVSSEQKQNGKSQTGSTTA